MESRAADDGPQHVDQVGGSHYHSVYQHWDWVADVGMPYLEGNATKYVVRWKSKNGKEDLLKAKSYVAKILIRYRTQGVAQRACQYLNKLFGRWVYSLEGKAADEVFFGRNDVEHWERRICTVLRTWRTEDDLILALQMIDFLMGYWAQNQ